LPHGSSDVYHQHHETIAFIAACSLLLLPCPADNPPAGKIPAPEMIALAQAHSPKLRDSIEYCFGAQSLKDGTAWVGEGPEFFFAVEAATAPLLVIDEGERQPMLPVAGSAPAPFALVCHCAR
jgi:hypothetical protein